MIYSVELTLIASIFVEQGDAMKTTVVNFRIPAASMSASDILSTCHISQTQSSWSTCRKVQEEQGWPYRGSAFTVFAVIYSTCKPRKHNHHSCEQSNHILWSWVSSLWSPFLFLDLLMTSGSRTVRLEIWQVYNVKSRHSSWNPEVHYCSLHSIILLDRVMPFEWTQQSKSLYS